MGALRTRDQLEDEIIASYSPIPDSLCALIEEESWAELLRDLRLPGGDR